MRLDRPGVALLIIITLGGSIHAVGVEKTSSALIVALTGLFIYSTLVRSLK